MLKTFYQVQINNFFKYQKHNILNKSFLKKKQYIKFSKKVLIINIIYYRTKLT